MIDARLHEALLARMDYMHELAALKKGELKKGEAQEMPTYRPGREAQLMRQRAAAHRGDMELAALFQIWREVISASLRLQQGVHKLPVIVAAAGDQEAEAFVCARSWAGAGAQIIHTGNVQDFFAHMKNHAAMIGLISVNINDFLKAPWWQFMGVETHIVARWPFIAADKICPLYVLANMMPEDSGDDVSLYARDEDIVEVRGFILPDDERAPSGRFLGCYARPLDP